MVCDSASTMKYALPTLLCSRPTLSAVECPTKGASCVRRPAPLELVLEEVLEAPTGGFYVKNTFINGDAELSPTFRAFYRERAVRTCPSRDVGRLAEFAPGSVGPPVSLPTPPPSPMESPFAIATPTCDRIFEHRLLRSTPEAPPQAFHSLEVANPLGMAAEGPRQQLSLATVLGADRRGQRRLTLLATNPTSTMDEGLLRRSTEPTASVLAAVRMAGACAEVALPPPPPCAPAPGSVELPSLGSAGHGLGGCRPCAFLHTKGCLNGFVCPFCHLCGPEEKKRRRKQAHDMRRAAREQVGAK